MKNSLLLLAIVGLSLWSPLAQAQGQERGRVPGEMVVGKVTAVAADSVTVAPAKGGDPVTIKVSDDTRIMKERQPVKMNEIKVGDTVMARGQLAGSTLQARMLGVINPEMAERMQQGGFGRGFGGGNGPGPGQFKPEDWGKTFIAGRVKAINETTLTITSPDNQKSLNIEVDENTSFKRGRESITLADIKADDFVSGAGEIKNGVFVSKELRVGGGRRAMGDQPGAGQPGSAGPAGSIAPGNSTAQPSSSGQPGAADSKPAAPPKN